MSSPDKAQLKALSPDAREREEKERLARHRVLLKVLTELWLVGVMRSLNDVERPEDAPSKGKDSTGPASKSLEAKAKVLQTNGPEADTDPFPLEVLKELLGHDRNHVNLPLAVLFVKTFAWDVLGTKGILGEGRKTVDADGATAATPADVDGVGSGDEDVPNGASVEDPPLVSDELQERFRNILNRYLEDVKSHVVKDQQTLNSQARRNADAFVRSGEIFEDRQANYEKQVKAQDKLVANAQILCEALGSEMPSLAEKEASEAAGSANIGLVKAGEYLRGEGEGAGIWEDEDERRFYENLIDLRGRVPSMLLDDGKKKKPEVDEQVGKKQEAEIAEEVVNLEKAEPSKGDDQSTAIANKTVGAQVDALLGRLPDVQTKDQVDDIALEFCFLNSKASRNRLIKAVQEIPKNRSDLLPLYSRLVATLGQYLSDIPQALISYLDGEFRSLQRRKQKDFLGQVRTANIRYLAELTKFGVVPEHVIFHCFKVSLDDFSRMNIEIISNLLENCGRYMLRNPETAPRMRSFLDTLQRKKGAQHIGQQERMLIENAIYYVDPPERAAIAQKERTPMELYVQKLIYLDMNKRSYPKVLKSIRKLHWEESEVVAIIEKALSKPGKVKYSNIHVLAMITSALYRYHQDFVIMVIDDVLENITLGLEQNDFKFNQRRLAEVKYLGELYNYKMVDSSVIFDSLYRIVTFGHEGGTPKPGETNPLDMPDDFFRFRLVCSILDTCGVCFDRGVAKKKLDFFLTFFQYYMFTKDPLPMDVDFLIQDTFALVRPQWKIAADLSDAAQLFSVAVAENYTSTAAEKAAEAAEEEAESTSDDEIDGEDNVGPDIEDAHSSDDEAEALEETEETKPLDSDSEDEQIVVTMQKEQRDPEFEADFDREYEKMMAESLESRKFDRKPMFDVPLPLRRGAAKDTQTSAEEAPKEIAESVPDTMAFSLMTKRGNRQQVSPIHFPFVFTKWIQTRQIELPSSSNFAVAMKTQKQAEREEQQRIKNLVLNYDLMDEDETSNDPGGSPFLQPNPNTKPSQAIERHNISHSRSDRYNSNRGGQRSRKLQLSDVDWYGSRGPSRGGRGSSRGFRGNAG